MEFDFALPGMLRESVYLSRNDEARLTGFGVTQAGSVPNAG